MKQFEEIPFDVWLFSCRDKMTLELLKVLNPFDGKFYRYNGCFLQIKTNNDIMSVIMAIGKGKDWLGSMHETCKSIGIKEVRWITSLSNRPVNAISKYVGAKIVAVIPNYYEEYSANLYSIDLTTEIKRFRTNNIVN